jgi:hypothetical protein
MDALTLFGALSVSAMLAFAAACLTSSAYGFLQGARPFGVVELIWSGIALQRWHLRRSRTS